MVLFNILITISAILSFLSFAPFKFVWLILFCFVPLFFTLDTLSNKLISHTTTAKFKIFFQISLLFGIIYNGLTNIWTFQLVEFSSFIEIGLLFIVYTLIQSIFYCIIFCLFGLLNSPLYCFPFYWILIEYIKALGPFGSPNGVLGYCLSNTYLAEYASFFGVYFLSFIILSINLLLYLFLKHSIVKKHILKQLTIIFITILIFLLPTLINTPLNYLNKSINVGLVQVNHPISYKLIPTNRSSIRNDHILLSKKGLNLLDLDLIIWPETITASENLKFPLFMSNLNYLSTINDVGFIFGTPRKDSNKYYNSAALVYNNMSFFYDKNHLMPFGEYWPFKRLFKFLGLNNIIPGSEFSEASSKRIFNFKSVKLGVGICLETTMGSFYKDYAKQNAHILISLVNNGWFKSSSIAARQLQMLQIRAIETGLPILQSANMGFTCIIEPTGKILTMLPQFESNILTHTLNLYTINTLYLKLGNLIIYISLIIILIQLIVRKNYFKSKI